MLSDLACGCAVYLVTGYTDMRKGIDGLATIVQGKAVPGSGQSESLSFLRKKPQQDKRTAVGGRRIYVCFLQQFDVYCFSEALILLGFSGFF